MKFNRNISNIKLATLALLVAVVAASCNKKENLDDVDCGKVNAKFAANVKPIIDAKCATSGCHNANSSNGDFTNYAGVKAKADDGSIKKRVLAQKNMPPSNPLSFDELKKIKCWLASGAQNN